MIYRMDLVGSYVTIISEVLELHMVFVFPYSKEIGLFTSLFPSTNVW